MNKCNCRKFNKRRKDKKFNKKIKEECNSNPFSNAVVPPCAEYLENENILHLNGELIVRNANKLYVFITSNASCNNSSDGSGNSNYGETLDTNIEISITTFIIGLYINQIQRGIIKYDETKPIHQDQDVDKLIHQLLQNSSEMSDAMKESKQSDSVESTMQDEGTEENIHSKLYEISKGPDEQPNVSQQSSSGGMEQQEETSEQSNQSQQSAASQSLQVKYSLTFFISNGDAIAAFVRYQINITELNYIILFILNRLEGDPGLYYPDNSYATPIPENLYLAGVYIKP